MEGGFRFLTQWNGAGFHVCSKKMAVFDKPQPPDAGQRRRGSDSDAQRGYAEDRQEVRTPPGAERCHL